MLPVSLALLPPLLLLLLFTGLASEEVDVPVGVDDEAIAVMVVAVVAMRRPTVLAAVVLVLVLVAVVPLGVPAVLRPADREVRPRAAVLEMVRLAADVPALGRLGNAAAVHVRHDPEGGGLRRRRRRRRQPPPLGGVWTRQAVSLDMNMNRDLLLLLLPHAVDRVPVDDGVFEGDALPLSQRVPRVNRPLVRCCSGRAVGSPG